MRDYTFMSGSEVRPFKSEGLSRLKYYPEMLMFTNSQLQKMDREINAYSEIIPTDMQHRLIARSEMLGSVAIAKAEKTNQIRAEEIRQVRNYLNTHPDAEFIQAPITITTKRADIRKEHDKLEYFNTLKTYRWISEAVNFTAASLSVGQIIEIHKMLTGGLDNFKDKIEAFHPYRPGELRDNNDIEVFGSWKPPRFDLIPTGLQELVDYYKQNRNLQSLNLFATALYALHPFDNGNKRVCRILEHGLLMDLGLNKQRAYSPLHYYHENIDRFYNNLEKSMLTGNMTHAMNLSREAVFFSQLYVRLHMVEQSRINFIKNIHPAENLERFYRLFVKNKSIQHKNLPKHTKKIPARTMNEFLSKGVADGILLRTVLGKSVYYSLNVVCNEETFIKNRLSSSKGILRFMPPRLEGSIFPKYQSWKDWQPDNITKKSQPGRKPGLRQGLNHKEMFHNAEILQNQNNGLSPDY